MKASFTKFLENIRITHQQAEDAKLKYIGVCKIIHKAYYSDNYNGKTKLLFGSYKTNTNTRPLSEDQDVDVLFKIPEETYNKFKNYNGNGPSALLQEIRKILNATYTTTDKIKGWSKVVLVNFAENTHNVEVLPAFELDNGDFIIPNSENGGSWEIFNPQNQIDKFQKSNEKTNGLTADLTRIIKTWVKNTTSLNYKSFDLQNDIINFLQNNYTAGIENSCYHLMLKDCFIFLKENSNDNNIIGHLQTAIERINKAVKFISLNKMNEASIELRKIFGLEFPLANKNIICEEKPRIFTNPSSPYANCKIK